jgi:hypothetical protein
MAASVKVCGWRTHDGGAACTGGPAYANLQGRKPREGDVGIAAWAMGIRVPRMRWANRVEALQQAGGW